MITLAQFSIIVSFIGALFLAFSVIKNPREAHQMDDRGRKLYLASVVLSKFRIGIWLLVAGFVLQLLDTII